MNAKELIAELEKIDPDEELFVWNGNYPWEHYEPVKKVEVRHSIRRGFEKGGITQYGKTVIS